MDFDIYENKCNHMEHTHKKKQKKNQKIMRLYVINVLHVTSLIINKIHLNSCYIFLDSDL